MSNPFDDALPQTGGSTVRVSPWPLWLLVALSAIGIVVALLANPTYSLVAWAVLLLASFVLLFAYRLALVAATRAADADAAVVGIKRWERWTIVATVIACTANGAVLGWWIGGWEMWQQWGL